jgi:hypothetical protein
MRRRMAQRTIHANDCHGPAKEEIHLFSVAYLIDGIVADGNFM